MNRVLAVQMAVAAVVTAIALVLLHPAAPTVRHTCVAVTVSPSTSRRIAVTYVPLATSTRAGSCAQR